MGKSLIRPLTKTLLGSLIASAIKPIQRYVTTLNPAGGMYYAIPSITLTAGEYVEIKAFAGGAAWHTVISGEGRQGEIRKNIDGTVELIGSTSAFSVELDGTPVATLTTPYPNDGKIHTWKITVNTALTYSAIGIRGDLSGATMSGGYFSCKFFSSSGEVVRDYRFNDNGGVLVDYSGNNANGSSVNVTADDRELMTFDASRNAWVGGELTGDAGWTYTGGSSFGDINGLSGNSLMFKPLLNQGATYIASLNVTFNDGNVNNVIWDNSGATIYTVNGVGLKEFKFTHTVSSGNYLYRANGGRYMFDSQSLKQIIEVAQ